MIFFFIKIININKDKILYELYKNMLIIDDNFIKILINKVNLSIGDIIFIFVTDLSKNYDLSYVRKFLGKKFNLIKKDIFYPVWIINFPMFVFNKNNKIECCHHPFTMPLNITLEKLKKTKDYTSIISTSYDLVINGYELGSGSSRINNFFLQKEIFNILGLSKFLQEKRYGFFLNALKFGTPPHIGLALGLDRIIMLLMNINNIRDVIAFPKTTSGTCLLTGAPDYI